MKLLVFRFMVPLVPLLIYSFGNDEGGERERGGWKHFRGYERKKGITTFFSKFLNHHKETSVMFFRDGE